MTSSSVAGTRNRASPPDVTSAATHFDPLEVCRPARINLQAAGQHVGRVRLGTDREPASLSADDKVASGDIHAVELPHLEPAVDGSRRTARLPHDDAHHVLARGSVELHLELAHRRRLPGCRLARQRHHVGSAGRDTAGARALGYEDDVCLPLGVVGSDGQFRL